MCSCGWLVCHERVIVAELDPQNTGADNGFIELLSRFNCSTSIVKLDEVSLDHEWDANVASVLNSHSPS